MNVMLSCSFEWLLEVHHPELPQIPPEKRKLLRTKILCWINPMQCNTAYIHFVTVTNITEKAVSSVESLF